VVGLAYAAVSVYWAAGGTWLLDTVGGGLGQQGRAGDLGVIVAVWAAAALKFTGAVVPLAAAGADHRALAWHAYLWDPWFLLWGVLVTAALVRSRLSRPGRATGR
jgi:hypothetical protein